MTVRKWMKTAATAAFMAAGLFTLGAGAAHADITTSGDGSVGSGNQVVGEVNAPINISGNAVGVLGGIAGANATDTSASVSDSGDDYYHSSSSDNITTSGDGSVLSGNQIVGEANVPINVCGNAVAGAIGAAGANCENAHASVE
jgi:hypothetical protein